jgi:hypothetical protein
MSQTTLLTMSEVQTALRLAALPPAAASPFAGMAPPPAIEQSIAASLASKGVIHGNGTPAPAWIATLRTLASPTHRIAFFLGSAERWFDASYYSSGNGLVGYTQGAAECGITFPCDASDVEALLADWLNWRLMPETGPFEGTLYGPELTAFAAIVDAYREETLRSFIERRPGDPTRLSRAQLTRQLTTMDGPDSRWLCAVLKRHAPEAIRPDEGALNTGARSMAERGLLRFEGEAICVEGNLYRLCAGMANIVPYAYIASQRAGGGGSSAIYLTGLKCYWVLDFPSGADGQPSCRFQGVGGEAVATHVRAHLGGLPAARPAPAASWSAPPPIAPPEPVAAPVKQPVTRPLPNATEPIVPHCGKCGKMLKLGKRFCGSCGAPVR